MSLKRRNILDLIGKDRNRYSSCLVSCFTFDFTFFEQRMLYALRLANVRNINVLLDGDYLEKTLEKTSGNEFQTSKTYSLNPIYVKGVFHPKIMLLFGSKHALLILGSGNLTSSGLSTNDEVWGAFHMDSLESPNAPIIAAAWNYLHSYFPQVKGYNRIKLSWIKQRSLWIKDLETLRLDSFVKIGNKEILFLGNKQSESIYEQLETHLPKTKLKKLSIVSPYFDEKGKLLEAILSDYEIDKIECITDVNFGLLPHELKEPFRSQIQFYKWGDCIKKFEERVNRLHAKIFQFEYEDGSEYLMIGSPNATINALGNRNIKEVNAEAALLIRRKRRTNYLNELGISTKGKTPFELPAKKSEAKLNKGDESRGKGKKHRVLYSEYNEASLKVYLAKKLEMACDLELYDNKENLIESYVVSPSGLEFTVAIENIENAFKICLTKEGERISNYALIHIIALQSKCNPDPKQAELNAVIERLEENPDREIYVDLLKFMDYYWVDDDFEKKYKGVKGGQAKAITRQKEATIHLDITQEELYELGTRQSWASEMLNNPNGQLADLLSAISKDKTRREEEEIEENEEEALLLGNVEFGDGAGGAVPQKKTNISSKGEAELKAILKHLEKVKKIYSKELRKMVRSQYLVDSPSRMITLRDLSNQSIVLNLLYLFFGKKYLLKRTEFCIWNNRIFKEEIKKLKKKYQFKFEKKKHLKAHLICLSVDSNSFDQAKKDIECIHEDLFLVQETYYEQELEVDYFRQGNFAEKGRDGLKKLLIDILGRFLICSNENAGFKKYAYEQINSKMDSYRIEILEKSLFLLLSIQWKFEEVKYRDLLLLDLLHFMATESWFSKEMETKIADLEFIYSKATHKSAVFKSSLKFFFNRLLPSYTTWKNKYKTGAVFSKEGSRMTPYQIVFNQHIGFAHYISNKRGKINLDKTGFSWDEKKDYLSFSVKDSHKELMFYGNNYMYYHSK